MALLGVVSLIERLLFGVFFKNRKNVNLSFMLILFAITLVTLLAFIREGWWFFNPAIGWLAFALVLVQSFRFLEVTKPVYMAMPQWMQDTVEKLSTWGVFAYLILVFLDKIF